MANPFYDHQNYPQAGAPGSSAAMRAELDAIETGFDLVNVNITDALTGATGAATLATTKAAEALVSANNADISEAAALASQIAAAASAMQSATSASNSAISAAEALATKLIVDQVYDNFDDRYLGSKVADPTVDNDGMPLQEGTLYYNSTLKILKYYNGTVWVSAPSGSAGGTTFTPTGNLAATNVQQAIAEVDAEKLALAGGTLTGLLNLKAAASIPSSSIVDLTAATGNTVIITGVVTITEFLLNPGQQMEVIIESALQLTHNPVKLSLNSGLTYITKPGDRFNIYKDVSNVIRVNLYVQNSAGKHTAWIPAGAMISRTTSGAASGNFETATNKIMLKTLDFDASISEFSQFSIQMPKGWDQGAVSFKAVWSHAATSTNFGVAWSLQAVALSDNEAADTAFGTIQTVTDAGGVANNVYITAESNAITIAGTPQDQDWVVFQVERTVGNAGDTMAIDARLHGIQLYYTTDSATDA